jgi:hypothetical protein
MDALSLGLAVVVGLLLVKEAGLPVPIPGDLLVIGLGVGAAQGRFDPIVAIVAILVASIVGGSIQFLLIRGPAGACWLGCFGGSAYRASESSARPSDCGAVGRAPSRWPG